MTGALKTIPPFVFLFLIGLIVPIQIFVGPLRLSTYRIVLVVLFIPCLVMLVSGKVGRYGHRHSFCAFCPLGRNGFDRRAWV